MTPKTRNLMIMGILLLALIATPKQSAALDLVAGTWSIGGSASTEYTNRDSDQEGITDTYRLDLSLGRLIAKNIELGASLIGSHTSSGTGIEYSYGIVPYATYHIPMSEISGFFLSLGVGYERITANIKRGPTNIADVVVAFGEAGWQYFFTPHVAFNLGIRYAYRDTDGGGATISDTIHTVSIPLRLKIYY